MAVKKNSGKNKTKKQGQVKQATQHLEEEALPKPEDRPWEDPVLVTDAPPPANEPVPVAEIEKELAEAPQGNDSENDVNAHVSGYDAREEEKRREREMKEEIGEQEKVITDAALLQEKKEAAKERPATSPAGPRLPGGISTRPLFNGNPYMPMMASVMEVIEETANIRTLRLTIDDPELREQFRFEPGQVGQISVFGAGEATFVINSPPSEKHYLQFSVMKTGEVTDAIHRLAVADKVGLRAPLGNFFPYESWKGKNIFFVGGGIGMAPIRTIMLYLLEHKEDYGKISLLYGARSPKDMAYSYELDDWTHNPDLNCTLCIDNPHEAWHHKVGLIPTVLKEINPSPDNTVAVLCGPPIMIKFTLQALKELGFDPQNIVTTLEKRMKCGIGICGRCNIGDRYVCVDGPVFTMRELDSLPADY